MSNCNNCDPTCLEQVPTKCSVYDGKSFPEIGISQGDSLVSVIEVIGENVEANKSAANACGCNDSSNSSDNTSSDLGNVQALSTGNISEISTEKTDIKTSINGSGLSIKYDFNNALSGLGKVSRLKVDVLGKYKNSDANVVLESTKTAAGAFTIPTESCPITINVLGYINKEGVEKEVNYSRVLPCQDNELGDFINATQLSTSSVNTQGDVNSEICNQLDAIKSQMASILNFSIDGSNITDILLEQKNTILNQLTLIEECKEEISNLKSEIERIDRTV